MKSLILAFVITLLPHFVFAQSASACTVAVTINDAITASTSDYLVRAEKRAVEQNCQSLLVRVNTPGGSLQSTRLIVEKILSSPIPYLCLITPSGGHAGSAGAIILQACHVNGGAPATNIGAATPILGTGEKTPEDLRKKLINDTVSWMEGVTKLRQRNLKFSEEIITEAKALSVEQAHKLGALDILAQNELDFLQQSQGRKVQLGEQKDQKVVVGDLKEFSPDNRYKLLSFVADPEFAYLLFMGSIGLLYVEITHPGMVVPGVVGGIGLVLSLVAFHKLEVEWGGLALILLGVGFLIAEMFVASFGILGIGGLVAVFFGSLFLFDTQSTGYSLPLSLILSVVSVIGLMFLGIGYLAMKTIRHKSSDADSDLQQNLGEVYSVEHEGHQGQVQIMGEVWQFESAESLKKGDAVKVLSRHGLTLKVQKKNKENA